MTSSLIAFTADVMLGRLARWLRMLGYDTAYQRSISDEALVAQAVREDRWLLTRDRHLVKRKQLRNRHTLLVGDRVADQLRQLRLELKLDLTMASRGSSRCPKCNVILESIRREDATPRVPPFVANHHAEFLHCSRCKRVYWPGTHWTRFLNQLEELYGQ